MKTDFPHKTHKADAHLSFVMQTGIQNKQGKLVSMIKICIK